MKIKYCPICERILSTKKFYKNKLRYDKLHSYCKECEIDYLREYNRKYRKKYPALFLWHCINNRCNNPKHSRYKDYGAKGIKNLLTIKQIEILMKKYNFKKMKEKGLKPRIHRKNIKGNYEMNNVIFIKE